jgi:hypothetical protein
VSFRVVSRGDNRDTLQQTVQRIRVEMWRTPVFRYVIEVVTDVYRRPYGIHFYHHNTVSSTGPFGAEMREVFAGRKTMDAGLRDAVQRPISSSPMATPALQGDGDFIRPA